MSLHFTQYNLCRPHHYYWTAGARAAGGTKTTVPRGSYDGVLVTQEFSEQQADGVQLKYYAPGVGNVRVGFRGRDKEGERLELVKVEQLNADGLARARAEALRVDERAKMYCSTPAVDALPGCSVGAYLTLRLPPTHSVPMLRTNATGRTR